MLRNHVAAAAANQVSVLFAGRVLSFNLASEATFADLAERVNEINNWHNETPTAVSLKLGHHQPRVEARLSATAMWVSFLHRYA